MDREAVGRRLAPAFALSEASCGSARFGAKPLPDREREETDAIRSELSHKVPPWGRARGAPVSEP